MLSTPTDDSSLAERRRYREWMNRSIGVGTAGFFLAVLASLFTAEPTADRLLFAGVGVYYLGFLGYLAVWGYTGVRLFDEREAEVERRAGGVVSLLVTTFVIFALPADVVLSVTGAYDVPVAVRGAIWGYFLLMLVYLLVYGYVERRHT
jgi:hypothetical protein